MSHSDFLLACQSGQKLFRPHLGEITMRTHKIGQLVLTSGKVVACDPFVNLYDTESFSSNLKPGSYPVFLLVAHFQKNNDCRVAYAMLQLRQQTSVRWEMGTRFGEDLSSLKPEEILIYPVDSATGCFVDVDTIQLINHKSCEIETFEEDFTDRLQETLSRNYSDTWDWAVLTVDESTNANLVAFQTGWGDGRYANYFGYDAEDNIVNLVTDFNLFD